MAYCGPRGIRYADFLDWDDLSRDAALAWHLREQDRCGSCGQAQADWHDENGVELRDPPFEPRVHVCPSCSRLDAVDRDERDSDGKLPPGMQFGWAASRHPEVEQRTVTPDDG